MRTRDEMIEGLSIMFDANDPEQEKAYATEYYEEIAARAVHDDRLALLGPRPKRCADDTMQCRRFESICPSHIDGSCECTLTHHYANTRAELFAQCPKVEE